MSCGDSNPMCDMSQNLSRFRPGPTDGGEKPRTLCVRTVGMKRQIPGSGQKWFPARFGVILTR